MVVVFTCNSCPFAQEYEDRIIALAKAHAQDVAFVAINVNRVAEDSLEKMQLRAKEKQFPYPYLYDQSQQIAKAYGATFTPEFFVLGPERKIVYMGGLDNNSERGRGEAQLPGTGDPGRFAGSAAGHDGNRRPRLPHPLCPRAANSRSLAPGVGRAAARAAAGGRDQAAQAAEYPLGGLASCRLRVPPEAAPGL